MRKQWFLRAFAVGLSVVMMAIFLVGCDRTIYPSNSRPTSTPHSYVDYEYDPVIEQISRVRGTADTKVPEEADVAFIHTIWEEGAWEKSVTKDAYDYVFETTVGSIRYVSADGRFNDPNIDRTLLLSEEQRMTVNDFLSKEFDGLSLKEKAETVVEGMTYAEVREIMGCDGEDIGFGLILYQWTLSGNQRLVICMRNVSPNEAPEAVFPDDCIVTEARIEAKEN